MNKINEKHVFYGLLLANILGVFLYKFYPSVDGPSHLYNAQILSSIIEGDNFFSQYLDVNAFYIPNWTSQILLSFLLLIFPAWLSEKIFIASYIILFALSFRYLIKTIRKENLVLSIIIFPFIFSYLFHMGFYNFSIALPLMILTYAVWKKESFPPLKRFILLFLLFLLLYFSNVLVFGFTGLTMGIGILVEIFLNREKMVTEEFHRLFRKLLLLLGVSVFPLTLLLLFLVKIPIEGDNSSFSFYQLTKWLMDFRPLIVYDYNKEEIITEQFFHLILILGLLSFFYQKLVLKKIKGNSDSITFAVCLGILVVSYYFIPQNFSAGMMSDRLLQLIVLFGVLLIAMLSYPVKWLKYILPFFVFFHIVLQIMHLKNWINPLNKIAIEIEEIYHKIETNSIVLPINFTNNWKMTHFSSFVGLDKNVLLLDNYEASLDWFPIKWNQEIVDNEFPSILNTIDNNEWIFEGCENELEKLDYILVFDPEEDSDVKIRFPTLSDYLINHCVLEKSVGSILLYKIKREPFSF